MSWKESLVPGTEGAQLLSHQARLVCLSVLERGCIWTPQLWSFWGNTGNDTGIVGRFLFIVQRRLTVHQSVVLQRGLCEIIEIHPLETLQYEKKSWNFKDETTSLLPLFESFQENPGFRGC